jgi:hypothetical protein
MKGTFEGRFDWTSSGARRETGGGRVVWVGSWSGTFRNAAGKGFMHDTSWTCLGTTENKDDKPKDSNGFLVVTDGQGSQAWAKWTGLSVSQKGEIKGQADWINGTGEWAGLTGDLTYTGQANLGTDEGYVNVEGSYQTD